MSTLSRELLLASEFDIFIDKPGHPKYKNVNLLTIQRRIF